MYLAILSMNSSTDPVDLFVHFSPVMVTLLTSAGNCEGYAARMPRTNTSDLAKPLMRLAREFLCVPTGSDTYGEEKKQLRFLRLNVR